MPDQARAGSARAGCTIAAKQEWALARVTAASFAEHHPGVPFYVLLADEPDGELDPSAEPFTVVRLEELAVPPGQAFRYDRLPFGYSLTPRLLRWALGRGHERVLFIKQESLVCGPLATAFGALEDADVVLTPHLLAPRTGEGAAEAEEPILLAGAYNGGIVGVAGRGDAPGFLSWWQDRVDHHCLHAPDEGMHFEQRWLDLAPALFDRVAILRDPGCNVGHWNHAERELGLVDGRPAAGGRPCSLVRFSGFDERRPEQITRYFDRGVDELGAAAGVWELYRRLLVDAGIEATRAWGYAFDRFDDGTPVPDLLRLIYRGLGDAADGLGDPFEADAPNGFVRWLRRPVDGGRPAVIRLWDLLWHRRPDLQRAFPDHLGADRERFLEWALTDGMSQHELGPGLVEVAE